MGDNHKLLNADSRVEQHPGWAEAVAQLGIDLRDYRIAINSRLEMLEQHSIQTHNLLVQLLDFAHSDES